MLEDELAATWNDGMHEQRCAPQAMEGVAQQHLDGTLGRVLGKRGAALARPPLVDATQELVHLRHHRVHLEAGHVLLVGEHRPLARGTHVLARPTQRQTTVAVLLRRVEARACNAIEDVGEQRALLENGVGRLLVGVRIEHLGRETRGLDAQAERNPVRAQLLGRVMVE